MKSLRVACPFETPSLIVKSFEMITRSEMFAAYQSRGFRYELFNTGYSNDGDNNLPIHERQFTRGDIETRIRQPLSPRRNFQVS